MTIYDNRNEIVNNNLHNSCRSFSEGVVVASGEEFMDGKYFVVYSFLGKVKLWIDSLDCHH